MKLVFQQLILICLPLASFAQCYEATPIVYAPNSYNLGSTIALTDDIHSNTIDLGFNFCFFGDTVNRCVIASNGYVTFIDTLANQPSIWSINDTVPYEGCPTFCVMAPWQDINPGAGGTISYNIYGSAPFRKFVVSYFEVAMFSCTTLEFTNQIVLYESSNVIDINIKDKELCTTWNGGAAVQGIVNMDGSEAVIVPGRNFPELWETHNDAWRFTPICSCPSMLPPEPSFVSGSVYEDVDNDCEFDLNEPTIPFVRLNVLPDDIDVITNSNGAYSLQLDSGQYFITQSALNPPYLNYTCTGNYIPFEFNAISSQELIDLGNEIQATTDLTISIGSTNIVPCESAIQTIEICNLSSEPKYGVNAFVQISDPYIEYHPDSTSGFIILSDSTLSLTIDSLGSFECRTFHLAGTALCDSILPPSNTCYTAEVEVISNEFSVENNSSHTCLGIGGTPAFFRKTVLSQVPGGQWTTNENIQANDELVYRIEFTNLGSVTIQNLTIIDTLSEYLDHSQIEFLASSHEYFLSIEDDALMFNFLNIELPSIDSSFAESQLYVIFRIHQWPGNSPGIVIENTAHISIESSNPFPSNKTKNVIIDYSSINELLDSDVIIFPNPTTGELFISNSSPRNAIRVVEVLDTQGRMLLKETGSGVSKIDMGQLSTGIYLVRIETEIGSLVKRVVRN